MSIAEYNPTTLDLLKSDYKFLQFEIDDERDDLLKYVTKPNKNMCEYDSIIKCFENSIKSLEEKKAKVSKQIEDYPHCPPPTRPLPDIPTSVKKKESIEERKIRINYQVQKEIVEDYEEMIDEIEEFKSTYFFDGATYKGEINNTHREKMTSDVFQQFEDMMSPDSYNWGGWRDWNSNIRRAPWHPTNVKTIKLCTKNLNRFRKCCDDRVEHIKKTIAEYDL